MRQTDISYREKASQPEPSAYKEPAGQANNVNGDTPMDEYMDVPF